MGVSKGERFRHADVYVDYPFESVLFRWDFLEKKIYRRFYGENESSEPIPYDNRLFNEAICFGDEITREEYIKGKAAS